MGTRIPLDKSERIEEETKRRLEISVFNIGLGVREANLLETNGIFTVEDVLKYSRVDLEDLRQSGPAVVRKIIAAVKAVDVRCEQTA